jgi:hypothetical protein
MQSWCPAWAVVKFSGKIKKWGVIIPDDNMFILKNLKIEAKQSNLVLNFTMSKRSEQVR